MFEVRDDAGSPEESGRLDRLVTRVAPRPKHWAMKWRPNDSEDDETAEQDRHPARTAGQSDGDPATGTDAPRADACDSPRPLVLAESTIDPVSGEIEPDEEDAIPASLGSTMVTSRTWRAADEASRRHPITPSPSGPDASVAKAMHAARPQPVVRRRFGLLGMAGWIVAVLIAAGWWLQRGDLPTGTTPTETEITSESVLPPAPVLARPAVDPFEADLAREEIASLRQERARLVQEVRAAAILLEDHRRLAAELKESTVTNTGAAVELGVLEDEARRWRRRHEVAIVRMDELAELLVEADAREEMLAEEVAALRRWIAALDASNGAD